MLGVRIVYGFGKYSLSERGRSLRFVQSENGHKYYYPKEFGQQPVNKSGSGLGCQVLAIFMKTP